MGMPINTYNILSVLSRGGENYEIDSVHEALAPFKAFAFIIHDPEKDPDFHQFLSREFDRLDYATGNKLLFFALVDPPEDWLVYARNRDYFRELSWLSQEVINPHNYPKTSDPSISAYTLAKSLGIDYRNLPCIVLTNDFRNNTFYWVKTDRSKLFDQFFELGHQIRRLSDHGYDHIEFDRLFYQSHPYRSQHRESLATILSSVLSFMVNQRNYNFSRAEETSILTLRRLFRVHKDSYYDPYGSANKSSEETQLDLVEMIALLIASANRVDTELIDQLRANLLPIPRRYLEQDSEIMLRTAVKVYSSLTGETGYLSPVLSSEDDFSPGIISFAKIFEREINLSIVHFLRDHKGIDLPTFYDAFQSSLSEKLHIGQAYLNSQDNGLWKPPALGQSKFAFQQIFQSGSLPPGWALDDCEKIFLYWDQIHQERNQAAHQSLCSLDSLNKVLNALSSLNSQNYFHKLYLLKSLFRGDPI